MARKLAGFGHQVKLISPRFVRPFVKSNKNDFVDAEAICEAASRPSMRFVTPGTESQQTLGALHRVCESLIRDRTGTVNQLHGFLLEFGISLPVGQAVIKRLPAALAEHALPPRLIAVLDRRAAGILPQPRGWCLASTARQAERRCQALANVATRI